MTAHEITRIRVQPYIRLGAFTLVFLSAVALMLTQRLYLASTLLMAVIVPAWFLGKRGTNSWFWEIASFLYLIFFFLDLILISHALAPALVHLFVFILINKLFNLQTSRDYYQLYLLTFLSILAASSLSVEIEMFYMIVLYIFSLVWNIVGITLFKEWSQDELTPTFPISLFGARYLLTIAGTSIATMAIAMAIFFILPRLQLGYFSHVKVGNIQHVSGFSQKVELGDIAEISNDQTVAMRVKVISPTPAPVESLYWRGISFDHYDGKSWATTVAGTRFLYQDSGNNFYNVYYNDDPKWLVKQEFYLEPLDTRVIFGMDRIIRLHGPFGAITRDANQTLTGMSRAEKYEVLSKLNPPSDARLGRANPSIPDHIRKYYLQLPYRSQNLQQLAQRVAGSGRRIDQVRAIKNFLETNYTYTTENLPIDEKDPISVFLFDRKAGHCEFFATSMAVMLRYVDVPARVVNGFLRGEYNELADFYVVRNTDAHTWVEVYFDGSWYAFDPSPRSVAGADAGIDLMKYFWEVVESIKFFWDRYVLIFSAEDQINVLTSIRDQYEKLSEYYKSKKQGKGGFGGQWSFTAIRKNRYALAIVLSAFIIAAYALRLTLRRIRRKKTATTPIVFYQKMLSLLESKGYPRALHITPHEFIKNVSKEVDAAFVKDMQYLTDLFYRSRYGHYAVSPEEARGVEASLQHLEKM